MRRGCRVHQVESLGRSRGTPRTLHRLRGKDAANSESALWDFEVYAMTSRDWPSDKAAAFQAVTGGFDSRVPLQFHYSLEITNPTAHADIKNTMIPSLIGGFIMTYPVFIT